MDSNVNTSTTDEALIKFMRSKQGVVTSKDVSDHFNISVKSARSKIHRLIRWKIITTKCTVGDGRSRKYEIIRR